MDHSFKRTSDAKMFVFCVILCESITVCNALQLEAQKKSTTVSEFWKEHSSSFKKKAWIATACLQKTIHWDLVFTGGKLPRSSLVGWRKQICFRLGISKKTFARCLSRTGGKKAVIQTVCFYHWPTSSTQKQSKRIWGLVFSNGQWDITQFITSHSRCKQRALSNSEYQLVLRLSTEQQQLIFVLRCKINFELPQTQKKRVSQQTGPLKYEWQNSQCIQIS